MSDIIVATAGTAAANGMYTGSGSGQEAVYTGPSGYYIQYDGMGAWVLWDDAWNALYCDDWMGNTNPWEAASWGVYMTGESPAPTVAEVSGFSISGTVELGDTTPVKTVKVTATASGEEDVVTYTDENGDYTLENLADETTWRVTPTKLACTFSPTYLDVEIDGGNESGKDFTATETGHDVSGTVADAGTGYVGATVSATDGVNVVEATTTTGGSYTLENLPDDDWTITCTAGGRDVLWASRVITVNEAALDHVDFVALVPRGDVAVLGAGTTGCNGAYALVSGSGQTAVYNGPNGYVLDCYEGVWNCWFIRASGGDWQYDDGERGGDGVSDPWLVETWYVNKGSNPVPTVTQGGDTYIVTGTILDGSSNPVPGVLITATASGESNVTAYTGPDGKYVIGGLADSATWRLTPTKADWTFTETYEDVAISGADETGVDFVGAEGGGEGLSSGAAAQQAATAAGSASLALSEGAAAQQATVATGIGDLAGALSIGYPEYQPPAPPRPAWAAVADLTALNRITCACYFDGAYWLGAVAGADGAVLYRVVGGVATPVTLPDSALVREVIALATDGASLFVTSGVGTVLGSAQTTGLAYRLDAYDGSAWTETTWDAEAFGIGTLPAGSSELISSGDLWGDRGARYQRHSWRQPDPEDAIWQAGANRRLRAWGDGGVLLENTTTCRLLTATGAAQDFALPARHTPNTLCWYQGRPWCLRLVTSGTDATVPRQVLCYGDPGSGEWQDVASWPVDTGGCYWYMTAWRGQLAMYGATITPAGAGRRWQVTLAPVRAQYAPPVLALAQGERVFTQSVVDGTPALALQAATAPAYGLAVFPDEIPDFTGTLLQVRGVELAGRTLSYAAACRELAERVQNWGATGYYYYVVETPELELTSLAAESFGVELFWVEAEWSDGSGDNEPELAWAELEWSQPPPVPEGAWLEVEWSDGSGVNVPELAWAEVEACDGYGEASPELEFVEPEWSGTPPGPELAFAEPEWSEGIAPPSGDEAVLVFEPYTPEVSPINSIRVVVPFSARPRIRVCLIRVDTGQAVDAWGTYEPFPVMANYTLQNPGDADAEYRVVLIGRGDVPEGVVPCWNPD